MKKPLTFLKYGCLAPIICALVFSANVVFGLDISSKNTQEIQNSSSQTSAAKLLRSYVQDYRKKINTLSLGYNIQGGVTMQNFNSSLRTMERDLNRIVLGDVSAGTASKNMSEIVSELKKINTRMKVFLEQEKILAERKIKQKQEVFSEIGKQISTTLDELILSVSTKLLQKETLSSKEKKLVESLIVLREENNKIKDFSSLEFQSIRQMQNYLQLIITEIRNEFKKIRNL